MENRELLYPVPVMPEPITVTKFWNPLVLSDDYEVVVNAVPGFTPNQIIETAGLVFRRPFFLIVNGRPLGRAEWDTRIIKRRDTCRFVSLPEQPGDGGGSNPLQIIGMIAVMAFAGPLAEAMMPGALAAMKWTVPLLTGVLAVGGMMLVNSFFANAVYNDTANIGSSDQGYSISGGGNRLKIGSPFAEQFGRMKIWPDLAMIPYTEYTSAVWWKELPDQDLYFLGIIGVGQYEIEKVLIDETPASSFSNIQYNIIPPGGSTSIITNLVFPNNALSGVELSTSWTSAVVNPAGTRIDKIGIDLRLPALFSIRKEKGTIIFGWFHLDVRCRAVDDNGTATTDWVTIASGEEVSSGYGTQNLMARSFTFYAPFGMNRYEISVKRTYPVGQPMPSGEMQAGTHQNRCYVGEIRGYGKTLPDYGDVTLLEMKIKANDQLTGAVANKINVVCTRKLYPVTSAGFGSTLVPSRCIIDAAAYVATSANGGNQPSSFLDFAALSALKTRYETLGYHFDWRFETRSSTMDVLKKICLCGLAIPYMPGGKLAVIHDKVQPEIPAQIFTLDDITEGSLKITHMMRTHDSPTCVEIHYTDNNFWCDKQLRVYDADGSEDNPAVTELIGCTNRTQAWQVGWYMYLDDKLCRAKITFSTGLKGHLPLPGTKIAIPLPTANFGGTGRIQSISTSGEIELSDDVDFGYYEEGMLYLVGNTGSILGPYTVVKGSDPSKKNIVIGSIPIATKTFENDGSEACKYLFTTNGSELLEIRVTGIRPGGPDTVTIEGSNYDANVYASTGEAPPIVSVGFFDSISLFYFGPTGPPWAYKYYISWTGSAGEVLVEIDEGAGFVALDEHLAAHGIQYTTAGRGITVRVTPYEAGGVLSPADALTAQHTPPQTPSGLALVGAVTESGGWTVSWTTTGAQEYRVDAKDINGSIVYTTITTSTSITVSIDEMLPLPKWDVYVYAVNDSDMSIPAIITVTPNALPAPYGFGVSYYISNGAIFEWAAVSGATGYVIYKGDTTDFDPAINGELVYDGDHIGATILFSDEKFFKIAAYNSYINDVGSLSFTQSVMAVATTINYLIDDNGNLIIDEFGDMICEG